MVKKDSSSLNYNDIKRIEVKTSKRNSFTFSFKKMALLHLKITNSQNKTSQNLRIHRRTLRNWVADTEKIFNYNGLSSKKRLTDKSKQRSARFSDCENKVYEWFLEKKEQRINLLPLTIQNKMLEEVKIKYPEIKDFIASYGWLQRFLNRFNLVKRRISGKKFKKSVNLYFIKYFLTIKRQWSEITK